MKTVVLILLLSVIAMLAAPRAAPVSDRAELAL